MHISAGDSDWSLPIVEGWPHCSTAEGYWWLSGDNGATAL